MRPCPASLAMARVPAKKWDTREDVLKRIETVRQRMEREPGRISLDEMANEAAISPYHFHRIFKATFGMTPLQFLTQCRLNRAKALLEEGGRSVVEVCVEVGFSSPSSFSKLFKATFGVSPAAFRRAPAIVGLRKR